MTVKGNKSAGAVIYTRVSTGEQAEHGTSLESQRAACRQKALALNLPIIAEYEDAGVSGGFLLTRQGIMSALADLQAGRADTLICANVSRYSRDVEHQQSLLKSVRAAGGRLVFCDVTFEETPSGDLMFGMMGQFAQWERQEIKKRTVGGRENRARQGLQPSRSTPPMGYHIIGAADVIRGEQPAEMVGKYVIVETEAAIVRELFALYAAGESLRSLTKRLNEQGVPTRGKAPYWGGSAISYMLHNPVYKGLGVYGKRDHAHDETRLSQPHPRNGKPMKTTRVTRAASPDTWITWSVPAIVSEELWDAVQARFSKNKRLQGGNPTRVRMLAGRVYCPVCGGGMMTMGHDRSGGKRRSAIPGTVYYMCGRQLRRRQNAAGQVAPETVCSTAVYSIAKTEAAVITALLDAAHRSEAVQAALAAYRETMAATEASLGVTDPRRELAALDTALAALSTKEAAAIKAQIAGIMAGASPDAYAAVFADLAAQRKDMENRRGELTAMMKGKSGQGAKGGGGVPPIKEDAFADMARVLSRPEITDAAKRTIIGEVIQAVRPAKEGAHITFLPGVFPCGSCSSGETVQAY